MRFTPLPIGGAYLLEQERHHDERGFFARVYCAREFADHGLDAAIDQQSVSFNERRGTLRGMHYQTEPHGEAKTITCLSGAVYDVLVDLREGSPTYLRWHAVELRAGDGRSVHLPRGLAHGFVTLEPHTTLHYQISAPHHAASARGLRHDDPALGIVWPLAPTVISARDASWPLLGAPPTT